MEVNRDECKRVTVRLRADQTLSERESKAYDMTTDGKWKWEGALKFVENNREGLAWYALNEKGRAIPFVKCMNYKEYTENGKTYAYGCSNHASTTQDILHQFSPYVEEWPDGSADGPYHLEKIADANTEQHMSGHKTFQLNEWAQFAGERIQAQEDKEDAIEAIAKNPALKDDPATTAARDNPMAVPWEKLPGACRICKATVPARFMRWPIGADDGKFEEMKNAVWDGSGLGELARGWEGQRMPSLGNETSRCINTTVTKVDGQTIVCGCANFAKGLGSWDASIGFAKDDDGFVVCNVCGAQQAQAIDETHRVGRFYKKDEAQTVAEKDSATGAQDEDMKQVDDFRRDIGLDNANEEEIYSRKMATRKLCCAEHSTFTQGCEECWKLEECTCVKNTGKCTMQSAVGRLLPSWVKKLGDQMFRMSDDPLRALFSSEDKHTVDTVVTLLEAIRVKAPWVTSTYPFLAMDHAQGDKNHRFLQNCMDEIDEDIKAHGFGMHLCKCNASNVEWRRAREAKQAEIKPKAMIIERSYQRWRTCLEWFDFLWGEKKSPYLCEGDRGDYKDLLVALLKQPTLLHEIWERAENGQRRNEREGYLDHKANPFIWSVVITMLVHFRKCARTKVIEDGSLVIGSDSDPDRLMGRQLRNDEDEFKTAHWAFLSAEEQQRWTLRSMCEYAEAHKDLYTCKAETRFAANSLLPLTPAERQQYRTNCRASFLKVDEEHTLVARTPPFLLEPYATQGPIETRHRWQERNKSWLFDFYCTIKTMGKFWRSKDKMSKNGLFVDFEIPAFLENLVFPCDRRQKNGRGDKITYYTFEDLDAEDVSVVVHGEAFEKARKMRGDEFDDAELRLQLRKRKDSFVAEAEASRGVPPAASLDLKPLGRSKPKKIPITDMEKAEAAAAREELYGKQRERKAKVPRGVSREERAVYQEAADEKNAEKKRKREEEKASNAKKLREEADAMIRDAPAPAGKGKGKGKGKAKAPKADDRSAPMEVQKRADARWEAFMKRREEKRLEALHRANRGGELPEEAKRRKKAEQEAAAAAALEERTKQLTEQLRAQYPE